MPRLALASLAAAAALLPALAACASTGGGSGIAVDAGDSTCEVATTTLPAGDTSFNVKNNGSKVTEVYVYGRDGAEFTKVISEVENIGPGTSRTMNVDLAPGEYEIACKPGQTGDGIRAALTVTGAHGATTGATNEAAYDRELEFSTDGNTLTGGGSATEGEKIEFKLENDADGPRTLEIKDPTGTVAGEAEDIEPGEDGEVVIELDSPGDWQVIVEGRGVEDLVMSLSVRAAA